MQKIKLKTNIDFNKNKRRLEELTKCDVYFVYQLENQFNHKKYYGIASDLLSRWEAHRMDLVAGRHGNKNMLEDYQQQRELNYKMSIISVCFDKEEALHIEKELIHDDKNCYNIMGTGKGKPRKLSKKHIEHAIKLKENHSYKQVEEMTGVSKSTLFRAMKERGLI